MTSYISKSNLTFNIFSKEIIERFLVDEGLKYFVNTNISEINLSSPFVKDKGRRCYINYEKGLWNDFLLGEGGSFIKFVRLVKKFDSNREAKEYIVKNYFDGNINDLLAENEIEEDYCFDIKIPSSFEILDKSKDTHQPFIEYLKKRELDHVIDSLILFCDTSDRRIVFPFYERGELVYWTARSIDDNAYLRWKNASGNRMGLVYNIDNVSFGSTIYIFEGIADALMVYPNGVALLGRSISDEQLTSIMSRQPSSIVVVMDDDKYGLDSQCTIAEKFLDKTSNVFIFDWSTIEGAKDFNDMGRDLCKIAIKNILPWNTKTKTILKMKTHE